MASTTSAYVKVPVDLMQLLVQVLARDPAVMLHQKLGSLQVMSDAPAPAPAPVSDTVAVSPEPAPQPYEKIDPIGPLPAAA